MMVKVKSRLKKIYRFYTMATYILLSIFCIYAIMGGSDNRLRTFSSLILQANAKDTIKDNPACPLNIERINTLKQNTNGFFKNLRFAEESYDASLLSFINVIQKKQSLKDFHNKVLLVNFWAIWCPPCRKEMPELANLKTIMQSDNFDVLTINLDASASDEKLLSFLKDIKADNLPLLRDKSMESFKQLRRDGLALGLPVTLLLDEKGCLLASYNGAAPWGNHDAQNLIKTATSTIIPK